VRGLRGWGPAGARAAGRVEVHGGGRTGPHGTLGGRGAGRGGGRSWRPRRACTAARAAGRLRTPRRLPSISRLLSPRVGRAERGRSGFSMLRMDRLVLREIRLPLREPFRISSGEVSERRILLLELHLPDGVVGWSECVAGEQPN